MGEKLSKISANTQEAISTIANHAYGVAKELEAELSDGSLGLDDELIFDIAKAFLAWRSRTREIKDPYCVWHFDGSTWAKVTKDMYQEDAYREWYRITKGGKVKAKPTEESYYYLGSSGLILSGRHEETGPEDDFSIKYLLSKSFGD